MNPVQVSEKKLYEPVIQACLLIIQSLHNLAFKLHEQTQNKCCATHVILLMTSVPCANNRTTRPIKAVHARSAERRNIIVL